MLLILTWIIIYRVYKFLIYFILTNQSLSDKVWGAATGRVRELSRFPPAYTLQGAYENLYSEEC